ncbi:MAG: hypothetical protein V3T23_08495 [Nitrososphaerales archaeon]
MSQTLYDAYQLVQGGGNVIAIAVGEASQAVTKTKVYILTTNTDCFVRFHASTAVAATDGNFDIFLPAGGSAILTATDTLLRVIRDTADGTLGFSEVARI